MKNIGKTKYSQARVAINAAIFTIKNSELMIYLETREKAPFEGVKELPGGILTDNESAEETLSRKIDGVLENKSTFFQQFYTFTGPKRDPRERVIAIGFIALVPWNKVGNLDNFQKVGKLPKLAFDHKVIVEQAVLYLRQNVDNTIVRQFMPSKFPINEFQKVQEVITQKKLDNRNFRKKLINSGTVAKVKTVQKGVPHRPAALYKFTKK